MGKIGGFLEITRVDAPERDPRERTSDFKEFMQTLPVDGLREQGARCMECGVPFCHNGCPLGNLIPDWNDLVYRDRTGSAVAERVLRAWTAHLPKFVKVMPHDYKRALREMAEAEVASTGGEGFVATETETRV